MKKNFFLAEETKDPTVPNPMPLFYSTDDGDMANVNVFFPLKRPHASLDSIDQKLIAENLDHLVAKRRELHATYPKQGKYIELALTNFFTRKIISGNLPELQNTVEEPAESKKDINTIIFEF